MLWRVGVLLLSAALAVAGPSGGTVMLAGPRRAFDLQGHRGARGLAPENTLVSFARALSIGVTTLELDLAVTRDDVVVVSHDPLVNPDITRTADGEWFDAHGPPFHTLTFAEVRRLDVGRLRPGRAYAAQFPDQAPADGTRIPRLAEVYALAKRAGNERMRFNVETKINPRKPGETLAPEPFVDLVLAVVREAGAGSRTTIQSFDWRTLRYAQRVAPDVLTVYLTEQAGNDTIEAGRPGASPWLGGLDVDDFGSVPKLVKAAGGSLWSPLFRDLTRESLAEAHALGLRVVPWTVNGPDDMEALIRLGVDGLITDRPDLGRRVMEKMGLELPVPTAVAPGEDRP